MQNNKHRPAPEVRTRNIDMEYLYTSWLAAKNIVHVGVEERHGPPKKKPSEDTGDDIQVTLHIMLQSVLMLIIGTANHQPRSSLPKHVTRRWHFLKYPSKRDRKLEFRTPSICNVLNRFCTYYLC